MNSKPRYQLSAPQRQLLGAIGIPSWHQRTDEVSSDDKNLSYFRIGEWLLVASEFPIPPPPWLTDLWQALAQLQSNDVSAVPVEISASIASNWSNDLLIQFNEPLQDLPTQEVKRAWWKHLCQNL